LAGWPGQLRPPSSAPRAPHRARAVFVPRRRPASACAARTLTCDPRLHRRRSTHERLHRVRASEPPASRSRLRIGRSARSCAHVAQRQDASTYRLAGTGD